jgi:hypothetical protein
MTREPSTEADGSDGSSSSLRLLKALHARKPRADLRSGKEKLLRHEPLRPLKVETNALLSILIEDIWKLVRHYIDAHEPGIVEPRTAADIAADASDLLSPLSEAAFQKRCDSDFDDFRIVRQLDECTKPVVFAMIHRWIQAAFRRMHERESTPTVLDRVFIRFVAIQDEANAERVNELLDIWTDRDPSEVRETLLRSFVFGAVAQGFVTAREVILGALAVAPEVFKRQFGTRASIVEMTEIAANLKPLVLMLAADDLESHISIANAIMVGELTEQLRPMDARMFHIAKTRGKLTLEINEDILKLAVFAQNPGEPRTGCPALESIGRGGKNVVTELYDWYMTLAHAFYFPRMKAERP